MYSRSPKATGQAAKFSMGKTGSGKPISSFSHQEAGHSWGPKDHLDAYRAHTNHAASLSENESHPKLIEHHQQAAQYHYQQAFPQSSIKKSNPHPHKALGKTRSGKTVYHHVHHHKHKHFNKQDHADAAHLHFKRNNRLLNRLKHAKGKMREAIQRLIKKHGLGVQVHGHAYHS
jgi:hypothetical protein